MDKVNDCVVCGRNIPEGDNLCKTCQKAATNPPDIETARAAAVKIKKFCLSRIHTHRNGCRNCPIKDICCNETYLWEV